MYGNPEAWQQWSGRFLGIRASLMGPSTGLANGPWRAGHAHREPTASPWPPPSCCGTQNLALSREISRLCRETFSSRHHLVNARMATVEAGKGKKGKNLERIWPREKPWGERTGTFCLGFEARGLVYGPPLGPRLATYPLPLWRDHATAPWRVPIASHDWECS